MDIKATDVKALRDATGAGMMDAKKALIEAEGDVEKAKQLLRERGQARAGKLSERSAEEGVVAAWLNGAAGSATSGVLLELNCATDFVAKTERFTDLGADLAKLVAEHSPSDIDALLALPYRDKTVGDVLTETSSEVGEPIRVRRFARFESTGGIVDAYLHQPDPSLPPKVGVLIELTGGDAAALATPAREVALHVAAMRPAYVRREDVPEDEVAKEREIIENQSRQEGKPEAVLAKIVDGRINAFFKDSVLLEQPYVRDDKQSVGQYLASASKDVTVARFARFRVGGE